MATVIWGESNEAHVLSVSALDRLLDELTGQAEQDKPFIVELVADNGATLSIGLGQPLSVMNFVPASLDPPYMQSANANAGADELAFYYKGDYSEFPPESGIPVDQAREGLRRFFVTGELPDNITWEET